VRHGRNLFHHSREHFRLRLREMVDSPRRIGVAVLAQHESASDPPPQETAGHSVNGCSGCPASWASMRAAHCAGCHLTFSTVANFDRHRRNFVCIGPEDAGLVRDDRGVWKQPGNGNPWSAV
jgi:hypothetical protein